MKSLQLCAAALFLLASAACTNAPKVFTEADVTKAQDAITHDYQNRGFEVEQISLVKDSDRHLSGFVKVRKASGIIRPQWTKTCSATMDQDSGKYNFGCQ
jgi:hypothetical protein